MKRRFFLQSMAALAVLPPLSFPNVTVKLGPEIPDIYELFLDAVNSVGYSKIQSIEVSMKVMGVLRSLLEDIQIRSFGPVRLSHQEGIFIRVSASQAGIEKVRTFTDNEEDFGVRLKPQKTRESSMVVVGDDETLRRMFSGELS